MLPRVIFDFVDGGAEDERTLKRNESGFDAVSLLPRPLDGSPERDLSIDLFGQKLALPLMIAPTGLAGLLWPDGEVATARAAAAAGTAYCLSHASVCTLEALATAATEAGIGEAPRWMQTYIYKDREHTRQIAGRAAAAGYDALVVTVDTQLLGNRERDIRNGFAIPPRLSGGEIARMAFKLRWLMRMRSALPRITFGNYVRPGSGETRAALAERMLTLPDPGLTWRDIEWLRGIWSGPLVIKGILHPEDGAEAVAHGIDGVIVSNHGGRQLDGAAAAIDALPGVVNAVEGGCAVLIDGGFRRGTHVLKALALGADCCCIGRPQLWGLATAGEAGVAHALDIFRRELDLAMGLSGLSRIDDIGRDILAPPRRDAV